MKYIKNLFIGLLHNDIIDKAGNKVQTAITTLDIHDIARISTTFGVNRYYIINSLESQIYLVNRIVNFWIAGKGSKYNPTRSIALKKIKVKENLNLVLKDLEEKFKNTPVLITTSAKKHSKKTIDYKIIYDKIANNPEIPYIILFGTGWGICKEIIEKSEFLLPPIEGYGEYNHLPVRSAVSIILDRIFIHKTYGDR